MHVGNRKIGRNGRKKWLFPSAERTDVTEKVPGVGVATLSARGAAVAVTLRGADVVSARSRRGVVFIVVASARVAAVVAVVALLVL